MVPYSQEIPMTIMMMTTVVLTAEEYILMVFGLWLGYSILWMKIVTIDKCIWDYTHAISPSRITGILKSYTSLSPSGT